MTNADIGNRLRLANETVSRTFGRLSDHGIVTVDDRRVKILDIERLAEYCPRNLHLMDERRLPRTPAGNR